MKDLIDRQAAIDALKKLRFEEPDDDVWNAFYKGYDQGKVAGQLDTAMARKLNPKKSISEIATTILQSQNSRQTQGLWIPCSERLPEEGEYVLLSFSNYILADIGRYETDEQGGAFYPGDEDKSYVSYGIFVNAWMPLPEPYQEVSE